MILLIDIGNSNIVFGCAKENNVNKIFRVESIRNRSFDEYYFIIKNSLEENVDAAIIASVVPEITEKFINLLMFYFGVKPLILGKGTKTGLNILTDNPKEVGSDLISDCCGLIAKKEEGLIIDLGTATKFIYLEGNALKGVVIYPGIKISLDALVHKTALLPEIDLEVPKRVLGLNSVSSMQSGLTYGTAALLEGMIRRIKNEVNKPDLKTFVTGGLADLIIPLLNEKVIQANNLLLDGLLYIYYKNI